MAAHQRFGEDEITVLDRIDDTPTGLRFDIDADRPKGQFTLERTACHRCRRRKQRHVLEIHLARGGIVAPLAFCHRLDQRHEDAQHALVRRNPPFLHPA